MVNIAAVYGSPRRKGNTSILLNRAVAGARDAGAEVAEIVLRDLKMSPCLEIYGCRKDGHCVIDDDFRSVETLLKQVDGLMLASPIFFYSVSAHTKILMDRCNSLWVKKYWIDKKPFGRKTYPRKGLFISVGSTRGKRLFEGALLSVKIFLGRPGHGIMELAGVPGDGDPRADSGSPRAPGNGLRRGPGLGTGADGKRLKFDAVRAAVIAIYCGSSHSAFQRSGLFPAMTFSFLNYHKKLEILLTHLRLLPKMISMPLAPDFF